MKDLKMELVQVNEALETIAHTLDSFGEDPELLDQMKKLLEQRDKLTEQIKALN